MLFTTILLTPLLFQGPQAKNVPREDTALLPDSCVAYLEVPGIAKKRWTSLFEWLSAQLASGSRWEPFFPAKVRKGMPLVRSILKGLPRNGIYERMVDLASRPFSLGLLRGGAGKLGFYESFRCSSPGMARYTARKLRFPSLRTSALGNRVLLSDDQWVLDAFQEAWARQMREGSPSAAALRVGASLPKTIGPRGFLDLVAFRPSRSGGKKGMRPLGYLFFGSWAELLQGSDALSFGLEKDGKGFRGSVRFKGVVERMGASTKAILGVGKAPRLGAAPPGDFVFSMAFDREIPAFLSNFEKLFPLSDQQGLQGFYQQLELFFRGQRAEKLLASLKGPFRFTEYVPAPKAPALRRGGGTLQLGGAFLEAGWADPKTRKMLPSAMQLFSVGANQQRKNRGKRSFLLRKRGGPERGMLRASLKAPLREEERNLEDLLEPRLAWLGERVALGIGGAKIWDALESPPQGNRFHEFYTLDCARLWELVDRLGPLAKASISLNTQFPPKVIEKAYPLTQALFEGLGRLSLGLRWGKRDALLSLQWRPGTGEGGAR
ncbi:MAG TPA: hypothetical protein ENK02_09895 [Planctomycetes bacterium]|nr:hypothetical protein [Planctomycetota bacterium]